jgi:hypothetical protein
MPAKGIFFTLSWGKGSAVNSGEFSDGYNLTDLWRLGKLFPVVSLPAWHNFVYKAAPEPRFEGKCGQ